MPNNIYSNSLANQSLVAALLLGTYTNTTRLRKVYIDVFADQIAGNGNYVVYATRQRSGAGSSYEVGPRTTVPVPAGVTAQQFPTMALMVNTTDIIKCYLIGLAGDTTTPDTIMEVSEEFVATDASGNVTVGSVVTGAINRAALAPDTGLQSIRSNTAQNGAVPTITLDAGASAITDFYRNAWIVLVGGTGVGQVRLIAAYDGSLKIATVSPNWVTPPDNTSTFAIISAANIYQVFSSVGSVVGNVGGSVGGNVGGIQTGGITAASFAADAIGANAIAPNAIGASELAADAVAEIADQVWDEVLSGHLTAGSTGAALNGAGSAGDPWNTTLPGAYGAGSAGKILGTNLDVAVSTRTKPADTQAAVTNLTNAPTNGDFTAVMKTSLNAATPAVTVTDKTGFSLSPAGILAIWNQLTSGLVTAGSIGKLIVDNLNVPLSTISGFIDTEVAAIKTKTDQLTFTNANKVDATAATVTDKAGYTLSPAGVQAIWDALMTAMLTVGSIGKWIKDNLDVAVSTRLASSSYVVPPTTTAIADQVWDEALNTHTLPGSTGNALANASSVPPVGAYSVTVHVRDAATLAPLFGIYVTLKDATDTTILDLHPTDIAGNALFSLNAATYMIHTSAIPGYASVAAVPMVVAGNMTQTVNMSPIAGSGPPVLPGLCRLYGYQYLNGVPAEGVVVKARLVETPQTAGGTILEAEQIYDTSDATGYWSLDLVIAKTYKIIIESARVQKDVLIPSAASVDMLTFL